MQSSSNTRRSIATRLFFRRLITLVSEKQRAPVSQDCWWAGRSTAGNWDEMLKCWRCFNSVSRERRYFEILLPGVVKYTRVMWPWSSQRWLSCSVFAGEEKGFAFLPSQVDLVLWLMKLGYRLLYLLQARTRACKRKQYPKTKYYFCWGLGTPVSAIHSLKRPEPKSKWISAYLNDYYCYIKEKERLLSELHWLMSAERERGPAKLLSYSLSSRR